MSRWQTDGHGLAFKTHNAKIYADGSHTWAMKLGMLEYTKGVVRCITYSLPGVENITHILRRRPTNIWLICHEKFASRAKEIKQRMPSVRIFTAPDVHSKVILIEPETIYVTSANFGLSGWHETTLGVRSKEAHAWYLEQSFIPLLQISTEVCIT